MRLALAIVMLTASTAAAQPPEPTPTERYGWKIAIADAISVTGAVIFLHDFVTSYDDSDSPDEPDNDGGGSDLAGIGLFGVFTYLLVPPVIHGVHRNGKGAALSLVSRLGLPLVGLGAGIAISEESGDEAAIAVGAALGAGTALVLDWTVFAEVERRTSAYTPTVTPVRDGGMTFGIAGSF